MRFEFTSISNIFKKTKSIAGRVKQLAYELYSTIIYLVLVREQNASPPKGIVFICHGNICRSAFADGYVSQCIPEQPKHKELLFYSFGLKAIENNSPPDNAVSAAHLLNVDLTMHKAKLLRTDQVGNDEWLIGMDFSHFLQLRKMFPARNGKKIFLLAHFGRKWFNSVNIRDPYGKSDETFNECFLKIAKHVTCLLSQIEHYTR
jgi:protein-tyrosine phosphatase